MLYPKEHQPCLELQQELTDITRKYNAAEKVAKYKAALQEKKIRVRSNKAKLTASKESNQQI